MTEFTEQHDVKQVDYLIIGAGMAGLTLAHFLKNDRTVLIDSRPGTYKIGESFIPETFHHPELSALVPKLRQLPSFSEKIGSIFISDDSVASFPLPIGGREFSAHVARSELEPLMAEHWGIDIVKERVRSIDWATKTVVTNLGAYKVAHQILDCSGRAMYVARNVGDVSVVQPAFATWAYYDILSTDASRFSRYVQESGREHMRYSITQRRVLQEPEEDGWRPEHCTILTQLGDGLWSWHIPLYNSTLLSFGVVSRSGRVTPEQFMEVAERTQLPHLELQQRPFDRSSAYNRLHVRNNFAHRARAAATLDYILVGDAAGFADPVYSVGAGLAVNNAIQVAALLNEGGWTDEKREGYCEHFEALMERTLEAFDVWYSGRLLTEDDAAQRVQDGFLVGNTFQVGIATHYADVVEDAMLDEFKDPDRPAGSAAKMSSAEATATLATLVGVEDGSTLAGWTLRSAMCVMSGLQHRWQHDGLPEMVAVANRAADVTQYYRRVGDIALSFMNLFDGPYPLDEHGHALFDAFEASVRNNPAEWAELVAPPE